MELTKWRIPDTVKSIKNYKMALAIFVAGGLYLGTWGYVTRENIISANAPHTIESIKNGYNIYNEYEALFKLRNTHDDEIVYVKKLTGHNYAFQVGDSVDLRRRVESKQDIFFSSKYGVLDLIPHTHDDGEHESLTLSEIIKNMFR